LLFRAGFSSCGFAGVRALSQGRAGLPRIEQTH
jgi:hypothetical protein